MLRYDDLRKMVDSKYLDRQLCNSIMGTYGSDPNAINSLRKMDIVSTLSACRHGQRNHRQRSPRVRMLTCMACARLLRR